MTDFSNVNGFIQVTVGERYPIVYVGRTDFKNIKFNESLDEKVVALAVTPQELKDLNDNPPIIMSITIGKDRYKAKWQDLTFEGEPLGNGSEALEATVNFFNNLNK